MTLLLFHTYKSHNVHRQHCPDRPRQEILYKNRVIWKYRLDHLRSNYFISILAKDLFLFSPNILTRIFEGAPWHPACQLWIGSDGEKRFFHMWPLKLKFWGLLVYALKTSISKNGSYCLISRISNFERICPLWKKS